MGHRVAAAGEPGEVRSLHLGRVLHRPGPPVRLTFEGRAGRLRVHERHRTGAFDVVEHGCPTAIVDERRGPHGHTAESLPDTPRREGEKTAAGLSNHGRDTVQPSFLQLVVLGLAQRFGAEAGLQREHRDADPVTVEGADAGLGIVNRLIEGEHPFARHELGAVDERRFASSAQRRHETLRPEVLVKVDRFHMDDSHRARPAPAPRGSGMGDSNTARVTEE